MYETVVKIDGMMCSMCESHVNDVIHANFKVKKAKSSAAKGETVIISEEPLDEAKLRTAIKDTGYEVKGVSCTPYEKKGLFGRK